MKYDKTDIPQHYKRARRLPEETITLWMNILLKYTGRTFLRTIVDLGCGTGRFALPLHEYFQATVYGIDPSLKMLKKAQETGGAGMVLLQGTAEQVPLRDSAADMVYCSQVFHHLQNKHTALAEIKRILKPKGTFCIRNSTIENLDSVLYLKFFPRAYKDDHSLLPARREVLGLLLEHGFALIANETIHQKFALTHTEYISKIKLRSLTDLAILPDSEFREGLRALEKYCMEHGTDTPVYEDMDFFVFQRA
jgi:ubiquinone/menaquinone biosynthesis C-methylase UbiE